MNELLASSPRASASGSSSWPSSCSR